MPVLKTRICCKPLCNRYQESNGYCNEHQSFASGWMRTQRGSRHKRGYGSKWDRLRKAVLRRDLYLCQEHLRNGDYVEGNHVDHIKPKSQGGTDDETNLQVLCESCHKKKTAAESKSSA